MSQDKHVRLGDVVVSNHYGVLQYDHLKLDLDKTELRSAAAPPSALLFGNANRLAAEALMGKRPWERWIMGVKLTWTKRPEPETDKLYSTDHPEVEISHPKDPDRIPCQPKIHFGRIASANVLLKDPKLRDVPQRFFQYRTYG